MNARVFLLVLVTAGFMALWDADRPAETHIAVARSGNFPGIESTDPPSRQSLPKTALQLWKRPDSVNLLQNSAEHSAMIPLPNNLQSGTWHAFNHDGDSLRITIERTGSQSCAAKPQAAGLLPEKPWETFCVITGDAGVRWCFIKQPPGIARLSTNLE